MDEDSISEIEALKEAVRLNRENTANDILDYLDFDKINEVVFQKIVERIKENEELNYKLTQALKAQEVINHVLRKKNNEMS